MWFSKNSKKIGIFQVFRNIAWLIFDKTFLAITNALILFVVANYYGAEEYGTLQYATNIVLILEVMFVLVDGRVTKKKYASFDKGSVSVNTIYARLIFSLIVLTIGIIIAFSSKQEECKCILIILLIDSLVKNMKIGMENRFEYDLLSRNVVLTSNIGLLIGTVLQIGAMIYEKSIVVIALIQLLSSICGSIILSVQFVRKYHHEIKCNIDLTLIKEIVIESIPLTLAAGAATIYSKCDSLMIGKMLSIKYVGIYSLAAKFVSLIQLFIVPVQTTVYIKMIEWRESGKKYEDYYLMISSLFTWGAIVIIIVSDLLIPLILSVFKPEYLPALGVFYILSVGTIFMYNAILRSCHFTLNGCGGILLKVQLITVIINVVLNYLFINSWGMNGAALATVISQFISLLLSNIFIKEAHFVFSMQIMAFNPLNLKKTIKKLRKLFE